MLTIQDHLALTSLDNEYWACADHRLDTAVELLFAEAGRLQLGTLDLRGRSAIKEFFAERARQNASTERLTRHVSSGFQPFESAQGSRSARSTVLVFAGNGSLPLTSDVPATIADVEDVFVRGESGQWLFESRLIKPVFVGPTAAKFAR